MISDGRDTLPKVAKTFTEQLQQTINSLNTGKIVTITGRYYTMDRDNRWDRTKKGYDLLMSNIGDYYADNAIEAIDMAYARGEEDEFIKPTIIDGGCKIEPSDIFVCMNFRADRVRQITQAITYKNFDAFDRDVILDLDYYCLTCYKEEYNLPIIYPPQSSKNILGEYIDNLGLTQLRIAESEKYPHVTFFFNGGIEKKFSKEDRILIPSPKVETYDLCPQMSAKEVTDALVEAISSNKYDFIVCNYANTDMVSHTGYLDKAIEAVEFIDRCLARLCKACDENCANMIITADHGNAEQMFDEKSGQKHTSHTTNLVPIIYYGNLSAKFKSNTGSIVDLAPTMLGIMNLEKPVEMTGKCLLEFN